MKFEHKFYIRKIIEIETYLNFTFAKSDVLEPIIHIVQHSYVHSLHSLISLHVAGTAILPQHIEVRFSENS